MIPFRTLCSRLRSAIKGMTPDEQASLGDDLPKCVVGGSSYSYRVDAEDFIKLCARVGICPITGERLTPLRDLGSLCTQSIGAGFAVKRDIEKLSLRGAADVVGVSASTLARIEMNQPVSIESVLAVCEFIGVHPFGYLRSERKRAA